CTVSDADPAPPHINPLSLHDALPISTSRPIGSGKGATSTSAPAACAAFTAASMSVTRYPVRSAPNGYGIGVLKPNSETVPTGVCRSCDVALLGVGVTVATTCLVL